ncbi:MAG: hypothetical protein U0324_04970 [Polyangiales bacterium]
MTTEPHRLAPSARWGEARAVARFPLALSLDGDEAVVLERRGELALTRWSLRDGALLARATLGPWRRFGHAALSPDGARVVACDPDGAVRVWDDPLRPPRTFALAAPVRPAAFRPDGARLAVWRHANLHSTEALDLDVLDLARGAVEASLRGGRYVAWAPDGRSLLTHRDGLRLWPADDGGARPGHVQEAAFLDGDRALTVGWDNALTVLRRRGDGLAVEATIPPPGVFPPHRIVRADARRVVLATRSLGQHGAEVWCFADGGWRRLGAVACDVSLVAADGARVVAFDRGVLVCWSLDDRAESRWHRGFAGAVAALAVRGPLVAAHDGGRDLRVFDVDGLAERWSLEPPTPRKNDGPTALCFGPDVRTLDTVNETSGLVRWDLAAGAVAATGPNVRAAPSQLVAAPDGGALYARFDAWPGSREPALRAIALGADVRWWKRPALSRHGSVCLDVRFDAGGRLLVLWASPDCVRETRSPTTGEVLARGDALTVRARRGALAADGAFAAVCEAEAGGEAYVAWVPAEGVGAARLGVASAEARVAFAGERLAVFDGEDWGLWRRHGAAMARAATLESEGCSASALAYDDATGRLVVGMVEGTLVTFAVG